MAPLAQKQSKVTWQERVREREQRIYNEFASENCMILTVGPEKCVGKLYDHGTYKLVKFQIKSEGKQKYTVRSDKKDSNGKYILFESPSGKQTDRTIDSFPVADETIKNIIIKHKDEIMEDKIQFMDEKRESEKEMRKAIREEMKKRNKEFLDAEKERKKQEKRKLEEANKENEEEEEKGEEELAKKPVKKRKLLKIDTALPVEEKA